MRGSYRPAGGPARPGRRTTGRAQPRRKETPVPVRSWLSPAAPCGGASPLSFAQSRLHLGQQAARVGVNLAGQQVADCQEERDVGGVRAQPGGGAELGDRPGLVAADVPPHPGFEVTVRLAAPASQLNSRAESEQRLSPSSRTARRTCWHRRYRTRLEPGSGTQGDLRVRFACFAPSRRGFARRPAPPAAAGRLGYLRVTIILNGMLNTPTLQLAYHALNPAAAPRGILMVRFAWFAPVAEENGILGEE